MLKNTVLLTMFSHILIGHNFAETYCSNAGPDNGS